MKRSRPSIPQAPPPASNVPGKRVKFSSNGDTGAPDDNDALDDLEADLETGAAAGTKKKVVTDGYDSDSSAGSDGEFGGGGGRKKDGEGEGDGGDEEEEDMFADKPKEEDVKGKGKAKEKGFLELGDIEGQEFGKGEDEENGGADEDDDDVEEDYELEDDLANDDDAPRGRRNKKTMGYQLSSFNMTDELAEGRFTQDGSYVQNDADPNDTHDTWLAGLSKAQIKAARLSKKKMDEDARRREENESRKGEEGLAQERDDCLIGILGIVRERESVAGALARLGAKKKPTVKVKRGPPAKSSAQIAGGAGGDAMEVDDDSTTPAASAIPAPVPRPAVEEDPAAKKIDRLTHFASTLLAVHGELEIYDTKYEDIVKTLREEGAVRRDWVPPRDPDLEAEEAAAAEAAAEEAKGRKSLISRPTAAVSAPGDQWYYTWKEAPAGQDKDAEFGPFTKAQLDGWLAGGYFGEGGKNIVIRSGADK